MIHTTTVFAVTFHAFPIMDTVSFIALISFSFITIERERKRERQKRRPRASNGQRYSLPCCTLSRNLKGAQQGKDSSGPVMVSDTLCPAIHILGT